MLQPKLLSGRSLGQPERPPYPVYSSESPLSRTLETSLISIGMALDEAQPFPLLVFPCDSILQVAKLHRNQKELLAELIFSLIHEV